MPVRQEGAIDSTALAHLIMLCWMFHCMWLLWTFSPIPEVHNSVTVEFYESCYCWPARIVIVRTYVIMVEAAIIICVYWSKPVYTICCISYYLWQHIWQDLGCPIYYKIYPKNNYIISWARYNFYENVSSFIIILDLFNSKLGKYNIGF